MDYLILVVSLLCAFWVFYREGYRRGYTKACDDTNKTIDEEIRDKIKELSIKEYKKYPGNEKLIMRERAICQVCDTYRSNELYDIVDRK